MQQNGQPNDACQERSFLLDLSMNPPIWSPVAPNLDIYQTTIIVRFVEPFPFKMRKDSIVVGVNEALRTKSQDVMMIFPSS